MTNMVIFCCDWNSTIGHWWVRSGAWIYFLWRPTK